MGEPDYLSAVEVAERHGISLRTVRRRIADGYERMLERRRRAFAGLDEIRARTKPPTGPHDTVDAILDAVREELREHLLDDLPPKDPVQ